MISPPSPRKLISNQAIAQNPNDRNYSNNKKFGECKQAKNFILWYKQMIDHEKQNLGLYLADDVILEWFGRTIKTRKKVSAFLKHDMQCSKHDFVSIQSVDMIQSRHIQSPRKEDPNFSCQPLELNSPPPDRLPKKRILRSNCNSPEWADNCQPQDVININRSKKVKISNISLIENHVDSNHGLKRGLCSDDNDDVNSQGDGLLDRRVKRKLIPVTPPNREVGQGDCIPTTSGTDSDRSHNTLNAQLPKLYVECNGYIQFTRKRNNRSIDAMRWERKCKAQISYSEDPLNIGEYIIWAIFYTDKSKCRRNLLPAFEEVAMEVETKPK